MSELDCLDTRQDSSGSSSRQQDSHKTAYTQGHAPAVEQQLPAHNGRQMRCIAHIYAIN
jgi:hypothetical protein